MYTWSPSSQRDHHHFKNAIHAICTCPFHCHHGHNVQTVTVQGPSQQNWSRGSPEVFPSSRGSPETPEPPEVFPRLPRLSRGLPRFSRGSPGALPMLSRCSPEVFPNFPGRGPPRIFGRLGKTSGIRRESLGKLGKTSGESGKPRDIRESLGTLGKTSREPREMFCWASAYRADTFHLLVIITICRCCTHDLHRHRFHIISPLEPSTQCADKLFVLTIFAMCRCSHTDVHRLNSHICFSLPASFQNADRVHAVLTFAEFPS